MKKSVTILAILIFLPTIFAADIEMKTEFNQGETLIAKVTGDFYESILSENIYFYKKHNRIPFLYDVAKINQDYYIYALLPETSENYSLQIKDVTYKKENQVVSDTIIKNFSISNQKADFSINPGIINTNKDFFIGVQNLKQEAIVLEIKNPTQTFELKSGEIKKINFEINDFDSGVQELEFSSDNTNYKVPVFISVEKIQSHENETQNQTQESEVPEQDKDYQPATIKTCEELEGKICSKGLGCNGESQDALDGKCCLGTCEEIESDIGWKITGWIILIALAIFAYWFVKKYSKTQRKFNLLDVARGK